MALKDIGARLVLENLGGFVQGVDRYNRSIDKMESKTRKFAERARATGTAITALTAPLLGIAALSVRSFAQFERSMARVGAVSQATEEELASLEAVAKEMGQTTVFSARQSASALSFMALAGLEVEEQIGALPQVLQLAAAGQLDLANAANIVTNVMAGFGLEVNDLARANDVLVTGFTSANTDLTQLGQAFKFAGPVAKAAGISFEETAAALAQMGNAGIQASLAGTSLRGAISRLLTPSNEAAAVLERLGINALDSSGNLRPFTDIIEQLETAGISAADAMTVFGLRAGPAMLALVEQGSGSLRELVTAMENSGGTAEAIAERQLDTLQGSLTLLTSATEGLQISLGSALAPAIRSLATDIIPVVVAITEWLGKHPKLTTVLVAGVAVIAALGIGLLAVGFIVPGLVSGFGLLTIAVGFLTGGFFGLSIAMGPITLIVLGIAAAVGVGILVWKNWATIIDFIKDRINNIITIINRLIDVLTIVNPLLGVLSLVGISIPDIPQFAQGGTMGRTGAAIVGERGPEVVRLPAGAQVTPISRNNTFNVTANYADRQAEGSIKLDLESMIMRAGA
ncbi:hypothetical protein LCGC14_0353660 [marine sediment metagenome]|uniref:Phage tail tape measure protein domain-containing protein n=1 Tax=marine sediment metagenome TaxID=412755 RepID=A0A0F9TFS1_9ZZZZ